MRRGLMLLPIVSQALWSLADKAYAAAEAGTEPGATAEAVSQLRAVLAVLAMAAGQQPETVLDHLSLLLKVTAAGRSDAPSASKLRHDCACSRTTRAMCYTEASKASRMTSGVQVRQWHAAHCVDSGETARMYYVCMLWCAARCVNSRMSLWSCCAGRIRRELQRCAGHAPRMRGSAAACAAARGKVHLACSATTHLDSVLYAVLLERC